MQKSDNLIEVDLSMIRIQALEWVRGTIRDLIHNNVTNKELANMQRIDIQIELNIPAIKAQLCVF